MDLDAGGLSGAATGAAIGNGAGIFRAGRATHGIFGNTAAAGYVYGAGTGAELGAAICGGGAGSKTISERAAAVDWFGGERRARSVDRHVAGARGFAVARGGGGVSR